jgi:xanthine dehydrogenase accessory factor
VSRLGDDGRIIREVVPDIAAGEQFHAAPGGLDKNVFNERFGEVTTPVLLFGAGHVGRAVVLALAPLPFVVRWIDGRPGQFPQYMPQNAVMVCADGAETEIAEAPREAMVVVMTHSHALDFDITIRALRRDDLGYVGLIGSETKRARFVNQARQMGITEAQIDRLVCPIGIPQIKGKEPAVIAATLAAQLLFVREQAVVLRDSPAIQSA